jgi:hypothetical protein
VKGIKSISVLRFIFFNEIKGIVLFEFEFFFNISLKITSSALCLLFEIALNGQDPPVSNYKKNSTLLCLISSLCNKVPSLPRHLVISVL